MRRMFVCRPFIGGDESMAGWRWLMRNASGTSLIGKEANRARACYLDHELKLNFFRKSLSIVASAQPGFRDLAASYSDLSEVFILSNCSCEYAPLGSTLIPPCVPPISIFAIFPPKANPYQLHESHTLPRHQSKTRGS